MGLGPSKLRSSSCLPSSRSPTPDPFRSKTGRDSAEQPPHATLHPQDEVRRTRYGIPGPTPNIIVTSDPTLTPAFTQTIPGSIATSLTDKLRSAGGSSILSSGSTVQRRNKSMISLLSNRSSLAMSVKAEPFVASLPFNIRAEASRPDRPNGQAKLSVAIDFGTVLSGVACGILPSTVKQIIWPRCRKVPSCLVYDAKGEVCAWGQDALTKRLKKGWVRCEMFKLWFDPTVPSTGILDSLPNGKKPVDVVSDYLVQLWKHAVPRILDAGYTRHMLQSADIWISIPAVWNHQGREMMREAISKSEMAAGLKYVNGWHDRLHIIPEPEAAAVHCTISNNLHLKKPQSFMVCDAGGGTIDLASYRILEDIETLQIAERCTCSGASCGSHFLDVLFRAYLEKWHKERRIPLHPENLHRFLRSFREAEKIAFNGTQRSLFDCFNTHDYDKLHLPRTEFNNGQFVVEAEVLRKEVFDPVVLQVIELLEHELSRVGSVDALLLVGGFSGSPYLFRCIEERFGSRVRHIARPIDGDIATSLGAARCGIAQSSTQRPLVENAIIVPKSYIVSDGVPSVSESQGDVAHGSLPQVLYPSARYIILKDAVWKKRQPLMETMTKVSSASDTVFVATFYYSDSDEMQSSTNGLSPLLDWSIDLGSVHSVRYRLNASPTTRYAIDFELGLETIGNEIYALWCYEGKEQDRILLDTLRPWG